MFEWLSHLLEWVSSLVPRLGICRATHAGVKFRRGKHVRVIQPGLYCYWPVVTEVTLLPTNRRTINLESQTLTTRDNATITVSCVVVYRIEDVVKAIVDTEDVEDTIGDVALRAATKVLTHTKFAEIRQGINTTVKRDITRGCRSALHPFGAKVLECDLVDFAETSVYRVIGGQQIIKAE